MKTKGGFRQNSGRPKGSGKYKEKTTPIRVPESLLPMIKNILCHYANSRLEKLEVNSLLGGPLE